MSGGRDPGELIFVGDVHLDRDDPALEDFLAFLEGLAGRARRLVLMGDLFNLWLGRRELEGPHQRAVVERLASLRARGMSVHYLEGNRDYGVGAGYSELAFDAVSAEGLVERWGEVQLFVAHGDLVNLEDRRYRAWRRMSRSTPVWRLFRCLPTGLQVRSAEALERRMRVTNLAFKRDFPTASIARYAERHCSVDCHGLVLGHFHVERDFWVESAAGRRLRVLVLPEWKGSRRHLRLDGSGALEFVDSQA
jgi:UDP-2,3-diacylglucosamine hydrolase